MIHWWWVRHGPTHEKTICGWRDVPADLSDTALIARVRDHLPRDAVVVSSDLQRAVKTADAVTQGQPRLPHVPELREINFGDWDGQSSAILAETQPELSRSYWETPGDTKPPGGESWNETSARVSTVVDGLTANASTPHIIAVAHFGTILTQVQRALNCTGYAAFGHQIDNLSVTHLSFDGTWRAEGINQNL